MPKKVQHLQDSHLLGRHPTQAECAVEVVRALRRIRPEIDIRPGIIRSGAQKGIQDLKITELRGGLAIRVSGHGCVQTIFVENVPDLPEKQLLVGYLIASFGEDHVHWHSLEHLNLVKRLALVLG